MDYERYGILRKTRRRSNSYGLHSKRLHIIASPSITKTLNQNRTDHIHCSRASKHGHIPIHPSTHPSKCHYVFAAISRPSYPFSPSSPPPSPSALPRWIRLHSSWSSAASTSLAVMLAASSSISSARMRLRKMARKAVTGWNVSVDFCIQDHLSKGDGGYVLGKGYESHVPAKPVSSTKIMAL